MIKNGDRVWVSDISQKDARLCRNERIYVGLSPVEPKHVCVSDSSVYSIRRYVSKIVDPVFGEGCPAKTTDSNCCRAILNRPLCIPENCILEYAKKKQRGKL